MSVCLYVIYILQNGLTDLARILVREETKIFEIFLENMQNINLQISQLSWGELALSPLHTSIMTKLIEASSDGANILIDLQCKQKHD